ncbi:MAG TPA: putative Ig domain-containing protein [Trebonia sp.]|nr:putative Ig domain-containing protein [Trebonia sp.]
MALILLPGIAVTAVPARVAAATGTTLFTQSFANNTVNSAYPVSIPALPSGPTGSNAACLTASGNTSGSAPQSCTSSTDANGSGKLRLTPNSTSQEGGLFAATSVPTSNGIDATFNTYQYGGSGADGIAFVLAAVNPANPVSPTNIGQSGGALGYSANAGSSLAGLADGYMGIGLDVYGNYSNSVYQGTGCTNPAYIANGKTVPGQVVVRGPGNGLVGYCAINSTATSTSSKALTLRASTRAASVVPVEVAINPTSGSFTTASGIVVASGTYAVRFTPVGGSATTLTGALPAVASGLYPSSSWTTSAGIPKQLAFGWVGSTGAVTDFHEVDTASVVSFNPVPQLAVSQTAYTVASPALGAPVTYTVNPSVSSSGASESSPVSVSMTLPAGVTPTTAYGTGWTCSAPAGQVITCTNSNTPFAAGATLSPITAEGIVTTSGVTSSTIASGSVATASSADGNPGYASSATLGTVPTAPSGITLSSTSGTIAGGNAVTISGSNISNATVIYIGTTSQQQGGTPVVLVPCTSGPAAGCFTVNANGTISISSMPSVAAATTVNVTVVSQGVAGAATYTYTDKPGTPAAPTATAGVTSATVSWSAPASNNSPITGYIVTPYLNGVAQAPLSYDATTTTRTITGLTAGGSYTFTVAAMNAIGTGAASPLSNAVIPYTVPSAPTIGTVSAGDSAAVVNWTAPASNGSSAITGYVVTPYINGVAQTPATFTSTATSQTVTGLTPGTSYTFKVAAINAAGTGPASAMSSAVTVNAGPSFTFGTPPNGEVSVAYSDSLTATGGTGALTWSVSSGTLPPGLSLNSATGLLSGTPTTSGRYTFTVQVADTFGGTATQTVTIVIAAVPTLSNPAPASGQTGVAYSNGLAVTGGTAPYTWSVSAGSLPPGLSLNPTTGVISGTPTAVGLYTFTVQVTDAFGLTATQTLSIGVTAGPLVISASASSSTVAQGGTLRYTITVTNTALTAYSGVGFSVPLGNVLNDATYNGDAAATSGTVSFASPNLTWTGNLAALATATITFSVTVNNPSTANATLSFTVTSATNGTNCYAGSTDARCSVSVPVSALTINQTTSVSAAAPGGVVSYTVTVTNTGAVPYTGATFTDPLSGVLDDATYNGDAAATSGAVLYLSPNLTWTGNLAVGATATITFSVTVNNPDTGNKVLASTITSSTTGSNCPSGGTDSRCTATVNVQGLTITSTANTATATPGSTIGYTITLTNTGTAAYTGASIVDSLSKLLDDATYNGDAVATSGTLSYSSPSLAWTGSLAAGATATITFSATVNNPDTGDKVVATTITSPTPGSNCPGGGTNPACSTSVTVLVPALTFAVSPSVSSTTPGSAVSYTVKITNSGQTAYTPASASISLAGVLDDATYNGDASATSGTVTYANPSLTWTGTLAVGASTTITYSVTVNNPDTGDRSLVTAVTSAAAGSSCPAGNTNSSCTSTVPVLVPGLTLSISSNVTSTTAGSTVQYTVVADNTGQTNYSSVSFTDSLAGVLDDAAYNKDAVASAGSVSFSSPNLTWTGSLAAGATATITYSVTVSNPDTGDKILSSTLTSSATGSNCPAGSTNPACSLAVPVASLQITNTSNVATTTPGSVVRFTATFTNTGQVAYRGITIATNASDVFDDAAPNGDQTATSGTLAISGNGVTWTGSIPVGGTVTVTGTVTVNNPDTGNKVLASTISTTAAGSNCPSGATDPNCSVNVPVLIPGLTISNTANTSTATPGSVVGYTLTITNSGQTAYSGITVTDSLSQALDDAAYNGDAAATAGSVSYATGLLTWTGSLAAGASATVTFSVTVNNPDTGDKTLIVTAASSAVGSSCPAGTTTAPCRSTVGVLTPALTIAATADASTTLPGNTVHYTITITNSGQTSYSGITVSDSLSGLLDDATYNNNAAATAGSVSFTSPNLTWTGSLATGAAATVTFSVTVNNPDLGDRSLTTVITSAAAGNNCPSGSTDSRCSTTVSVQSPALLTISVSSGGAASTVAGGVVHYTVSVTNSALTPYVGANFTDSLSGVLDDATYNGDAAASTGTASFTSPNLTWSGTVGAGATATITFSATVKNPDTGDKILASTITSTAIGSNCPAGNTDPRCASTVTVSSLAITNTANVASTTPGSVVRFTSTFINTGQTPYTGITITTNASDVFDDAVPNGDQTATSGTLTISGSGVTWTGSIPVGGTVTVTGTVTVNNPDTGNKVLASTITTTAAGSNCASGSTDPACSVSVPVLIPGLTIANTANTSAATPGSVVGYTLTITNSGQTPYSGITVSDSLSEMLDDAAYNGDAAATSGSVSYATGVLTWTGSLAAGASATVTFSVTVNNPDNGDKLLIVSAASSATGSTCPSGTTTAPCRNTIAVLTPALSITNGVDTATVVPGGTMHYTITINNSGQTAYTGITVSDALSGLLDDAVYNGDAAASIGTVSYASPTLTWTGTLAPGDTATVTFSATVNNPDTGDQNVATAVSSAASGSNCPVGNTRTHCTTSVPVQIMTISNVASTTTATPGDTVSYTLTVTNSGATAITDASVALPLTGVLDDATYNNNAVATEGLVSYSSPTLSWTGDLTPGQSTTITFSVTINNPDTGDKTLAATATSPTPGSNCPSSGPAAACSSTVTVLIPGLTITTSASSNTTTPGSKLQYTFTVTNTGQTSYPAATVTDDLTNVLSDATYNGDATATAGTLSYASPVLTWTGSLNPGDGATVTFSVTINNPDTGDKHLVNTVISTNPGSTCPPGGSNPACSTTVIDLIPGLTITKTASLATTTPGTQVQYTISVGDSGQTSYTGASVRDDLTGVLGSAAYNGDATATTGTVSYASPVLSWTGSLNPGSSATITYSVTVKNPQTGGTTMTNTANSDAAGSNCPSGTTGGKCTATVGIIAGALSITAPAAINLGAGPPGATLQGSLGTVQVTDNRGFGTGWTASVSSTNFATGGDSPAETIPAGSASYAIGGLASQTGSATFNFTPSVDLATSAQAVVSASNVGGNTAVSWNPQLQLALPGGAVGGNYTGTIYHSVS